MNATRDITGAQCWAVQILIWVRRHVMVDKNFITATPLKKLDGYCAGSVPGLET